MKQITVIQFDVNTDADTEADVLSEALFRHRKYLKRCRREEKAFLRALRNVPKRDVRTEQVAEAQIRQLTEELQAVRALRARVERSA